MVSKRRDDLVIAAAVIVGLIVGIIVWQVTKPENIDNITVDDALENVSALRKAMLMGTSGNIGSGNITLAEVPEGIQGRIENLSSSSCPDLAVHLTSDEAPASISTSIVNFNIAQADQKKTLILFTLDSTFDAAMSNGVLLYCTSTMTILGTGSFSQMAESIGDGIVSRGTFSGLEGHSVRGDIILMKRNEFINNEPVIQYFLRFESVLSEEGPDLYLYLTTNESPDNISAPNGLRVELDGIRFFAKAGNFQQDLPIGTDASVFKGANVWCDAFSVAFGKATLTAV